MKKYLVEFQVEDAEQAAGRKPRNSIYYNNGGDYAEAESPEEAISATIDTMIDESQNNGFDPIREEDALALYKNGKLESRCYNFKATEK